MKSVREPDADRQENSRESRQYWPAERGPTRKHGEERTDGFLASSGAITVAASALQRKQAQEFKKIDRYQGGEREGPILCT